MGSKPQGISGSRAAAVLGVSPWKTPLEQAIEILEERRPGFCAERGIEPPPEVDNAAVRWGSAFEDALIGLAESAHMSSIRDRELFLEEKLPGGADATVHLDGRYLDGAIHEAKTTTIHTWRDSWGEPGTDRMPGYIQAQVQHQLMMCDAAGLPSDLAIVSVLAWPCRTEEWEEMGHVADQVDATRWAETLAEMGFFHQYLVESRLSLWKVMREIYAEFWGFIKREELPPARTYDDVKRMFPEPRGTVVADEKTTRRAAEYKDLGKEIARLKKRRDELKAKILIPYITDSSQHPIDNDSVEALVLRDEAGRKIGQLAKTKRGLQYR